MAEPRKADSRGLNFFDITDFSPGIYNNSLIASDTAAVTPPGIFPAPPGAADAGFTFGCMSQPNGGLGPLPAQSASPLSLSDMGIFIAGQVDITALINSGVTNQEEIILAVTPAPAGGFQTTTFFSYIITGGFLNQIQTQTYTFDQFKNICCYPFTEMISQQPVVCLPLTAIDGPNSNLMVYPPVAAPTTFSVDVVATICGTAFGHQGRLVIAQPSVFAWPFIVGRQPSNEFISYTDPPQTETWPGQDEVFGPENPFGYGGMGSVSAGELFMVKCRGGSLLIQGDLNNPTVTSLPGVQPTGPIYGRIDTGVDGYYYCSENQGAWAWNGGNTSQKISTQLDDRFFLCLEPIDSSYYSYYVQRWSDWMLFSNNWIFNTTTRGWWRLDDPQVNSYFWYTQGFDTNTMYAAIPNCSGSGEDFLFTYDRSVPRSSYTWQSLPIKLPNEDRTSTGRELVIRASNPYPQIGSTQIIASLIDDKGNSTTLDTWAMTPGINTVQEIRLNSRLAQTTTIAVNLACSGTDFAPVVHGLSIGYRPREHVGLG